LISATEERRRPGPFRAIRTRPGLVISQLGNAFDNSRVLDELMLPIDKDVLMRMLSYYEIRSQTERFRAAPTKMNAAQPAAAVHRRKP